jgi:beta-lactamase superfamily II metal-dependent hydrolase
MLFSLEALRAKHGDSLLLHYGDPEEPRLIVIDGGPSGVYKDALKPRLEELRDEAGGKLTIEILMISHLDSDHVRGVLDFSRDLLKKPAMQAQYKVKTLWQNAFDDVVEGAADPAEAAEAGAVPAELEATVASVNEGRQLRDNAEELEWKPNKGFDRFVLAPGDEGVVIDLDPLRLTVVGPRQEELDALRVAWAKEVKKLKKAKPAEAAKIAAYLDDSVYNLSSIVCIAELGDRRMLLTGDARGDKILASLKAGGFLNREGKMELDLLKVPHHGSSRNLDPDFFKRLPARHLVISANGDYGNPDVETLEMISEARGKDEFTLHLTETEFKDEMGPKITKFLADDRKRGCRYEVSFRSKEKLSLRVDLPDPAA